MTTFYYRPFTSHSGITVKRPVATVYLRAKDGKWVEFESIIDSGADISLLPLSVGRLIGLSPDGQDIKEIGGIRGNVPVIYFENEVRVGNTEFKAKLCWALLENVPPLLGRADVFDRFNVTFKQRDDTILFEERKRQ